MRTGKTERKIDAMTASAEIDIEALYDEALTSAMRKHAATLRQMRDIMDGKTLPPRWCVTESLKNRWKERALIRIMNDSHIAEELGVYSAIAGDKATERIQRMGIDVYNAAYNGTMESLRG